MNNVWQKTKVLYGLLLYVPKEQRVAKLNVAESLILL